MAQLDPHEMSDLTPNVHSNQTRHADWLRAEHFANVGLDDRNQTPRNITEAK